MITATATHTTHRLSRMMPSIDGVVGDRPGERIADPSEPHRHGGSAPDIGLPEPNRERDSGDQPDRYGNADRQQRQHREREPAPPLRIAFAHLRLLSVSVVVAAARCPTVGDEPDEREHLATFVTARAPLAPCPHR